MKNLFTIITILTLSSCSIMKSTNETKSMESNTIEPKNISSLLGNDKPVQTSLLFNNVDQKVIVLKIQEDQILKEHISKVPALLICISGEGVYTEGKEKRVLMKKGDYLEIPKDVIHAVSAKVTSEFLLIK